MADVPVVVFPFRTLGSSPHRFSRTPEVSASSIIYDSQDSLHTRFLRSHPLRSLVSSPYVGANIPAMYLCGGHRVLSECQLGSKGRKKIDVAGERDSKLMYIVCGC